MVIICAWKALAFLDDDLAGIVHEFESEFGVNVVEDSKNKTRVVRRKDWKTEPMEAFDKSKRNFEEVLDFMKGKADI